jgi:hypothetical protein
MKPTLVIIVEVAATKFLLVPALSKLLAGITRHDFEMEKTTIVGFSDRYYD